MKIKTGDKVRVLAGKDAGKEGKVLQVFPKLERVVVENINLQASFAFSWRERSGSNHYFSRPGARFQSPVDFRQIRFGWSGRLQIH